MKLKVTHFVCVLFLICSRGSPGWLISEALQTGSIRGKYDKISASHVSLFDQSLQGIQFTDKPAFSFQGHPEASPGPQEIQTLFKKFQSMVEEYAKT